MALFLVGDKPPHWNPATQRMTLMSVIGKLPTLDDPVVEQPRGTAPRQAKQLKGERATALVQAYLAGASIKDLTEQYGVHRLTVSKILKRHDVELRKRRLTKDEIDLAVRLYEQGMSQARIADQIGASADGVRYQLIKRGVKMRGAHDWHHLP